MALKAVCWIAASYLVGCVPFGLLVSCLRYGQDLRALGSGNIGATNVLRNYGLQPFIAVMLLDMAKGFAAVAVGRAMGLGHNLSLLAGIAAIAGHNWSLFLRFKGGKGIATSGGVLIAAYPWPVTAAVLGVFVLALLLTRIMSVASLSAALSFPLAAAFVSWEEAGTYWPHLAVAALTCLSAIFKHRQNIARLLRGEEPRLGRGAGGGQGT